MYELHYTRKKSIAFSVPISMKVINAHQIYENISYTAYHGNRTVNAESPGLQSTDVPK